jgi:hypothetical protein
MMMAKATNAMRSEYSVAVAPFSEVSLSLTPATKASIETMRPVILVFLFQSLSNERISGKSPIAYLLGLRWDNICTGANGTAMRIDTRLFGREMWVPLARNGGVLSFQVGHGPNYLVL